MIRAEYDSKYKKISGLSIYNEQDVWNRDSEGRVGSLFKVQILTGTAWLFQPQLSADATIC